MATTANRFARGTGAYKCTCCGRLTRATGRGDNEHVRQCAQCYDLGGYENMIQDGQKLTEKDWDHVRALIEEVRVAGGDVDSDFGWDVPAKAAPAAPTPPETVTVTITQAELELLTHALRSHHYTAADTASAIERTYGAADGRSTDAWSKAKHTQAAVAALAKKFGVGV